jgi:hypothetical protein
LFVTTSSHGNAEPSTIRALCRRRHAVTNVTCVTSSASVHEPVSRNAWLYTARPCRSKSWPNAASSPFVQADHSCASVGCV